MLWVVLSLLHGIAQGNVATGNESVEHRGRHAERGRQLRGVEHAKTATRARAHVEHPAPSLHARHDVLDKGLYLRYGLLYDKSHLLVFMVDVGQQLMNAFFLKAVVQ